MRKKMILNGVNKQLFSSFLKELVTILNSHVQEQGIGTIKMAFFDNYIDPESRKDFSRMMEILDIKKNIIKDLHELGMKYEIDDFEVINNFVQVILSIMELNSDISISDLAKEHDITEPVIKIIKSIIKTPN